MTVVDIEAHERIDTVTVRLDRLERNLRIVNENVSRIMLALTDAEPLPLESGND